MKKLLQKKLQQKKLKKKAQPLTHATSNLGIWLNGKFGLYLEDLANPKDNADLIQTACSARTLADMLKKTYYIENQKI